MAVGLLSIEASDKPSMVGDQFTIEISDGGMKKDKVNPNRENHLSLHEVMVSS